MSRVRCLYELAERVGGKDPLCLMASVLSNLHYRFVLFCWVILPKDSGAKQAITFRFECQSIEHIHDLGARFYVGGADFEVRVVDPEVMMAKLQTQMVCLLVKAWENGERTGLGRHHKGAYR